MTTVLVMTILWLGTLIYIHKRTIPGAIDDAFETLVKNYVDGAVVNGVRVPGAIDIKLKPFEDLMVKCIATINDIGKELDDLYADDGNKKNKPTAESTLPIPKQ